MARPTPLNDAEFAKHVASLFVAGLSRNEMAEELHVTPWTISIWRRDPRVKVHAMKLIEDRVLQITRKVDSAIAERLENTGEMTVRELLEIRKEFLGGALRKQTEEADDATINEASEALESNPALAEELLALLDKGRSNANKE